MLPTLSCQLCISYHAPYSPFWPTVYSTRCTADVSGAFMSQGLPETPAAGRLMGTHSIHPAGLQSSHDIRVVRGEALLCLMLPIPHMLLQHLVPILAAPDALRGGRPSI